ncbi:MAG: hypothetical protein J5494_00655 [Candidatus Methanomethylophilaceae archaeon]|nr:hypothetical protein [Candidatus Methanomethylophilaceae archaeon]
MRTESRIIATVAAVLLLLLTAYAASDGTAAGEEPRVSAECTASVIGGSAELTVSVSGWNEGPVMTVDIKYDPEVLSISDVDRMKDFYMTGLHRGEGDYSVTVRSGNTPVSGDLFRITFDVSENAEQGQYPVFVSSVISETPAASCGAMAAVMDLTGDTDLNCRIDIRDSLTLRKYLAGEYVTAPEKKLDVNGDGKVDESDSAMLRMHLARNDTGIWEPGRETFTVEFSGYGPVRGSVPELPVCLRSGYSFIGVEDSGGNKTGFVNGDHSYFVMPASDCTAAFSLSAGQFYFFSLLPDGTGMRTENGVVNDYVFTAFTESPVITVDGISGLKNDKDNVFSATADGKDYRIVLATNMEYSVNLGDSLSIRIILKETDGFFAIVFIPEDLGGKIPSAGNRAEYTLKVYPDLISVPLFSTWISADVLSTDDSSRTYTVKISGDMIQDDIVMTVPYGIPIALYKDNIPGLVYCGTEKIGGKQMDKYAFDLGDIPAEVLDLSLWTMHDSDLFERFYAEISAEGVKLRATVNLTRYSL